MHGRGNYLTSEDMKGNFDVLDKSRNLGHYLNFHATLLLAFPSISPMIFSFVGHFGHPIENNYALIIY